VAIASYTIRYLTENQVASRLIQDSETLLAGIRFDEAGNFSLDAKSHQHNLRPPILWAIIM